MKSILRWGLPIVAAVFAVTALAEYNEYAEEYPSETAETAKGPADSDDTSSTALASIPNSHGAWRDPFWPIGYVPPGKKAPVVEKKADPTPIFQEEPKWDDALKTVTVKGVMKSATGGYVAVVNNKVVGEDEVITTTYNAREYSWKVARISQRGVSFNRLGE